MKKRLCLISIVFCTIIFIILYKITTLNETQSEITPEYVFTYAENQPEDYPTTQGAYKFAELVTERTNGRIRIQIHSGASLGDEKAVIEQLNFGGIDFTRASLSTLSEYSPSLNVLQLPYLYDDADHMWNVLGSDIGTYFMNSLDSSQLIALSWYEAGARNFYTADTPIDSLEDMKGMRIRIQESALMRHLIESLGAIPVPTTFEEVYSSLETGYIDGAENNLPSYVSNHHYETANYITLDQHTRIPELQLISAVTWNKLSTFDQTIIKQCALESAEYERMLWIEREKQAEQTIRNAGVIVIELTPEEKNKFQIAVSPLYEEFYAEYMDIIDEIMAVGE